MASRKRLEPVIRLRPESRIARGLSSETAWSERRRTVGARNRTSYSDDRQDERRLGGATARVKQTHGRLSDAARISCPDGGQVGWVGGLRITNRIALGFDSTASACNRTTKQNAFVIQWGRAFQPVRVRASKQPLHCAAFCSSSVARKRAPVRHRAAASGPSRTRFLPRPWIPVPLRQSQAFAKFQP